MEKEKRKWFAVLLILMFLIQDPILSKAHTFGKVVGEPRKAVLQEEGRIRYYLNGGVFPGDVTDISDIPEREGYNFAGWYTDSGFLQKAHEGQSDVAGDYGFYAKWTKCIDNRQNVQMYSYHTSDTARKTKKLLKNCAYEFLDSVQIPGMPATREEDVAANRILDSAQCPQGICVTDHYLLVSSYSSGRGKRPGSIHVFDRESGEYLVTLGMRGNSHMGGLAYDGDSIWVCHSGSRTLERIPYAFVKQAASQKPQAFLDCAGMFDEYQVANTPSCIAYYHGKLWVGTHTKAFGSRMAAYRLRGDRLERMETYRIPDKVQGIAFDPEGRVYLSVSYGRTKSSYLKVYASLDHLDQKPKLPMTKVEMPPCSEGIVFVKEKLYILFESASEKYLEGTDGKGTSIAPLDQVLALPVRSVLP